MKKIKELEKEIEGMEDSMGHDIVIEKLQDKIETLKEVLELIDEDIESCKRTCFCKVIDTEIEGLVTTQKICGNCHAKDQLEELKQNITGE